MYILSLIVILLYNLTVAMLELLGGDKVRANLLLPVCFPQVIGIIQVKRLMAVDLVKLLVTLCSACVSSLFKDVIMCT